jgi:hypothetical protein
MTHYWTVRTARTPLILKEELLEDRTKRGETHILKETHTHNLGMIIQGNHNKI